MIFSVSAHCEYIISMKIFFQTFCNKNIFFLQTAIYPKKNGTGDVREAKKLTDTSLVLPPFSKRPCAHSPLKAFDSAPHTEGDRMKAPAVDLRNRWGK